MRGSFQGLEGLQMMKKCVNCGGRKFTVWVQLTGVDKGKTVIMCDYCYLTDYANDELEVLPLR